MWSHIVRCQNCGHNNPPDSFFCEMCGSPLRVVSTSQQIQPVQVPNVVVPPPLEVKPVQVRYSLVGKANKIDVFEDNRVFGRSDFINMLSSEDARYISRQHFQIKYENGKYYIRDLGSKNGTKLNGNDITGKGWIEIKNGDMIRLADVLDLQFQT